MVSAEVLKECDMFRELDDEKIQKLVSIAQEESHPAGSVLYREGEASNQLYVVQEGKVFLEMRTDMGPAMRPLQVIIDIVQKREAFGWSAFSEPHLHTLSALTAEPTRLIVFDGEKVAAMMNEECQMGFGIMKGLTRLLASRLNHTRVLLISERALGSMTTNTEYA